MFSGVVTVHAALRRIRPFGNSVLQFMAMAVLGLFSLMLILWNRHLTPLEIVTAVALLGFGCELYLFLFTFCISSVSIALLLELSGRSIAATPAAVDPALIIPNNRIERMIEAGLLLRSAEGLMLTPQGKLILKIRNSLRLFFHHDS